MKCGNKNLLSVMIKILLGSFLLVMSACQTARLPIVKRSEAAQGGAAFYRKAAAMGWAARDSFILQQVREGAIPPFLKKFVRVPVVINAGKLRTRVIFFVSPDYLSIGNKGDWARVSLTASGAASVLSLLDCFAPTPQLVDRIYQQASVKLSPVPLYAYRDSTPIMWHHHLIIEGQRKQQKGLIAGIKKDIVFVNAKGDSVLTNRVGIYGWHQPDGKPIQPFYQGHAAWYTDYSHGLRLVSNNVRVKRRMIRVDRLLQDTTFRKSLF